MTTEDRPPTADRRPPPGSTLACPVRAQARQRPEAPAVLGEVGGAISYAALDGRVTAAARQMQTASVAAGDRVALYGPPDADYLAALWALLRLGAVACPLSTRAPADALAAQVGHLQSRTLVRFGEAPPGFGVPEGVRVLSGRDLSGRSDAPRGAAEKAVPDAPVPLETDRPATVVFTSGSTAWPKAAVHSLGNHYFSAEGSRQNIALGPGDRWLLSLPLYHVGGLAAAFRCAWAGAAVALPPAGMPLGEALAHGRATHASMVAAQLRRLLEEDAPALGHVRAFLLGGGPLPASLVEEACARGWPVHTSYGLTEMASQVTTTPPGASLEALRTAGRLLPHRQLRLAPSGEILVKGRTLFLGYLKDDARTLRCPVDADGWYATGDLGRLDRAGRLCLTGRADNLFISGGENIQPEEVEAALRRVPGVVEAVVVPVADAAFGQRPAAFVQQREGEAPPEGLAAALARHLPRFKIPVTFHAWPSDAPSGMKTDRAFFRAEAQRRQADDEQP